LISVSSVVNVGSVGKVVPKKTLYPVTVPAGACQDRVWLSGTFVALFAGAVKVTIGGGAICVVNVHVSDGSLSPVLLNAMTFH
jgi:hypothetical protein